MEREPFKENGVVVFSYDISTIISSYVFTHKFFSRLLGFILLSLFLVITPRVD